MKRFVASLLALLMTLTLITVSWADGESAVGATGPTEGTCGADTNEGGRDSVKWKLTPNGSKVAKEDADGKLVILPAYTLTIYGEGDIMDRPFADSENNTWAVADENGNRRSEQVTVVDIQEGITGIGNDCSIGAATVNIPASVTKIGMHNFSPTTTVNLAAGNTAFVLRENALLTADGTTMIRYLPGTENVDSYTVPASVKKLGGGALRQIRFNHLDLGSVESIGTYTFMEVTVEEIVLPDTLTTVDGSNPFLRAHVKRIVFGNGLTRIPNHICWSVQDLEEVVIGAGVEKIGGSAFVGCTSLRTVTFAAGSRLTEIEGQQAFANTKLESIELPESCTRVGSATFQNCANLRTIVAKGLTEIHYWNSEYTKATISYNTLLLGHRAGTVNGIGIAPYSVNGTEATILGWYKEDGTLIANWGYNNNFTKFQGEPTTVYAVYMLDCALDANGGTGDMSGIASYVAPRLDDGAKIDQLDKVYDPNNNKWNLQQHAKAPDCAFTPPEDCVFVGWNTEADGSGDSYNVGDYLKTGNKPITKLYAQWGKEVGGTIYTVSCTTPLTYTGAEQTPAVVVKEHDAAGGAAVLPSDEYTVAADTTFNAGMHDGKATVTKGGASFDIDFKYEIKKAPCALADLSEIRVTGGSTVSLPVAGTAVTVTNDSELGGTLANGTYTVAVPDISKNYTVTFTDAGDNNHEGGTLSVTVYVTARRNAEPTLSKTALTAKAGGAAGSVTYTYNGDGEVTAVSTDPAVATVTVDTAGKTITVTPRKKGTAEIVVTGAATENYTACTATLAVTVEARRGYGDQTISNNNGGTTTDAGKPAKSANTGDAGIALYAGMAIASLLGSGAVFSRKRKEL